MMTRATALPQCRYRFHDDRLKFRPDEYVYRLNTTAMLFNIHPEKHFVTIHKRRIEDLVSVGRYFKIEKIDITCDCIIVFTKNHRILLIFADVRYFREQKNGTPLARRLGFLKIIVKKKKGTTFFLFFQNASIYPPDE